MSIYESKQWTEDLDEILKELPDLDRLAGKSVLITGAGGLICSAVTDVLIRYNETHEIPVNIIAGARSLQRIRDRFGLFAEKAYFRFLSFDAAAERNELPADLDYIIHGAGNASPNHIVDEPVETMLGNFRGLYQLLDHAGKNGVSRVLYVSSSEVYGKKETDQPFKENEYGYIDLLNARNSYSVGKRAAETLCTSFAAEYGVDSVIVRPGHIYGPTALPTDNRVSSAWAYDVARGRSIVMKSDGGQIRSYCHCLDCASAILIVLLKGESGRAYNISNPDSIISIREMAQLLARFGSVELNTELPTEEEKKGFNPMSNSSLDSESLLSLGWHGLFDAERGFEHTVAILKESRENQK